MCHLIEFFKAELLPIYVCLSEGLSALYPRGVVFSGYKPGVDYTPLSENANEYVIVKDSLFPRTVYNVYDEKGEMVYTIERSADGYLQWILYSCPSRIELGRVHVSIKHRTISFNHKRGVAFRRIGLSRIFYCGLPDRTFYVKDGTPHEWVTSSKYLEKVINPGGGSQEKRIRLAKVTNIVHGNNESVWELSVDPQFDAEIALTTAFISMKTAWCPQL